MNESLEEYEKINILIDKLLFLNLSIKFSMAKERKEFADLVFDLIQHYKNIECNIRNTDKKDIEKTALRMYIKTVIRNKQMAGWLNKFKIIQLKFIDTYSIEISKEEYLKFIDSQTKMLKTVIKILNGDMYFVGCPTVN